MTANRTLQDTVKVYRPSIVILLFYFLGTSFLLLFSVAVLGPLIPFPIWGRVVFATLSAGGLLLGTVPATGYLRISPEGLAHGGVHRWSVRWAEVAAWSQYGPGQPVFLRTHTGRIRGFHQWLVWGKRWDAIAGALEKHCGPPASGQSRVVPRFLSLIGHPGKRGS